MDVEKQHGEEVVDQNGHAPKVYDEDIGIVHKADPLARKLRGRHMQMIAIGGAIGSGLFVASGSSLQAGGPAPMVICYLIVGIMLLFTVQALAEMAVLYPINGAFYTYIVRFVDPSWGFAVGWDYTLSWLIVLPFEMTAASITIQYWRDDINEGVWITVFLVVLSLIQIFGVEGYGEVEFILSIIKVCACAGFIILGVVINCGGVGDQGYIGARYWYDPGAFRNGFNGFAGVFVVAAFAFGGTELVGLAAAESENPRKAIPLATKQVFWRICFVYVANVFILGLIVPSNSPYLLNASGANTKASPFVLAIQNAGIKVLPSIFNAVITIAVLSVANSATFASTRTMQALAQRGMAPKPLAYVDKHGRPIWCVAVQLGFGFLAFLAEASNSTTVFNWLLAVSGLSYFFTWGSICLAHIRFRHAWTAQGYSLDQLPYRPPLGVWGSWIGLLLNILCLMASFYSALYPSPNATPNAKTLFQAYLAAPVTLVLYISWKLYTRQWRMWIPISEIDLTGARMKVTGEDEEDDLPPRTWNNLPMRVVRSLF